ncbi:tail protein X [Shewanella sp. VB17]|uniref:tail protein X n=1 Tax=Shewanella sp. VB17 TaxID=2739432 RepID=UPI0015644199|nr:tail protein X [Shewanella sp. VB17]NRD72705.1 tail protein X [Shewanella sp. VB17]
MKVVRSRDGDTAPLILWLALRRDDDAAEEALYAINPGLEQYGPILPGGVEITLPELPPPVPAKVVNVWD